MSALNRVQLIGNLGRDPEARTTQGGKRLVTLSIATTDSWRDPASGERREQTEWHRVVIWNEGLGELAERFLQKGAKVYLEGKLKYRKWTDQSGQERDSAEITISPYEGTIRFLDRRRDEGGSSRNTTSRGAGTTASSDPDDDIPF
jgi:single-strand DNA-binding protein